MDIKFVSYTGEFPNLCRGILTLEIDGEQYKFGHDYFSTEDQTKNFNSFWYSGGCIESTEDYSDMWAEEGPWEICEDLLPDFLKPHANEISEIFNDNVPYGCCGGCI